MHILSVEFLLFLMAVLGGYTFAPQRVRPYLLLVAGLFFYFQSGTVYFAILMGSILIDYLCSTGINRTDSQKEKRYYLLFSLFCNIGLLIGFHIPASLFHLILPLGLSFYVFKKISYMVDVYRGVILPEKNPFLLGLYVTFFPQIESGPIQRAGDLIPQFLREYTFDYGKITGGLKLIAWGLLKKIVIADRLAMFTNPVFRNPGSYPSGGIGLAVLFYSFQVYADFSGYTDIAVGIAQIIGIDIPDNFNRPYSATGIAQFWRRWHMTLSTWLRDYLFLPLAVFFSNTIKHFSKLNAYKHMDGLIYIFSSTLTMTLCGLWHGFTWTFMVWGFFHGILLSLAFITRKSRKHLRKKLIPKTMKTPYKYIRILLTFSNVTLLWIFFRAQTLQDAWFLLRRVIMLPLDIFNSLTGKDGILSLMPEEWIGKSLSKLIIVIVCMILMYIIHYIQPHDGMREMFSKRHRVIRWMLYVLIIVVIINFGVFGDVPFIYTQF